MIALAIHAGYMAVARPAACCQRATDAPVPDTVRIPASPMLPASAHRGRRPRSKPCSTFRHSCEKTPDCGASTGGCACCWCCCPGTCACRYRANPSAAGPGTSHFLAHALAAVLTTGCARLPPDVARPRSEALSPMADTHLAQVVRASAAAAQDPAWSGFRLLPDGDHALDARLALARRAQLSLDIQYYQIAADESAQALSARAARCRRARRVRVRLLVDDLNTQPSRVPLAHLSQLNPDFDDFSGVERRKCLMRIGVMPQSACGGDLGPWRAGEWFLNCGACSCAATDA